MIRRPPRSTQSRSSAASDVYKRQIGERANERPAGELADGRVDLGHADAITTGERSAPWQLPARLAVHERSGHAVNEHAAGDPLRRYLGIRHLTPASTRLKRIATSTPPPLLALAQIDIHRRLTKAELQDNGNNLLDVMSVSYTHLRAHETRHDL